MFFTSAITSILPYILFLGIICTYYLGITGDNLSFHKNNEATAVISTTVEHGIGQPNQDRKHFYNTTPDFYISNSDAEFLYKEDFYCERVQHVYQKNWKSQYFGFNLFSRPPPLSL